MVRKILPALIGAAVIASVPAAAAPRQTPEQELERALRGRVAGPPVDCITLRPNTRSRIINRTAIIFDEGSTIYVNRPRVGADSLNRWDTQVIRPFASRLCSVDTVQMIDPSSGIFTGNVFLGEFVPYRRVRD